MCRFFIEGIDIKIYTSMNNLFSLLGYDVYLHYIAWEGRYLFKIKTIPNNILLSYLNILTFIFKLLFVYNNSFFNYFSCWVVTNILKEY